MTLLLFPADACVVTTKYSLELAGLASYTTILIRNTIICLEHLVTSALKAFFLMLPLCFFIAAGKTQLGYRSDKSFGPPHDREKKDSTGVCDFVMMYLF